MKSIDDAEIAAVLGQRSRVPGREIAKQLRWAALTWVLKGAEIAVGILDSYAPVIGERILHPCGHVPTQPILALLSDFVEAKKTTGEDFL